MNTCADSRPTFVFPLILILLTLLVGWQSTPSQSQRRDKVGPAAGGAAAAYVEQGNRLAEENKWAEAIDAFKHAIGVDPKNAAAYGGLGDAYLNTSRWEEALAVYKEAVRITPADPVAQYNLGYCYNTMGRHGEAFSPLVKATILDPGFADAYYGIGYAYLRGAQYEKAVSFLKSAIRLDPDYAEAYYGLALVYTRLGKLNLADEPRKKLLALDAKLVEKLDREIRTPQQALAGPLPDVVPAKPVASVTKDRSESATATSNRPVETTPQPERVETPALQSAADNSKPLPASEPSQQKQSISAIANKKSSSSTAEAGVPAEQDPGAVSRQLPPPDREPAKEVIAPPPSPAPGAARVEEPTPPAPTDPVAPASTAGVTVWPAQEKRWALVIGVDNYSEAQISKLNGTANDARTLAAALIQYAGFPQNQVILLSPNQPPHLQPRRNIILSYLSNLRGQVPKDGLLLVSFIGHGVERGGRSYLLPSDAVAIDDPSMLEDTAINVSLVKDLIRATEVRQLLLLLDACRNDPAPGRGQADNSMTANFSKSFEFDLKASALTAFATIYASGVGQRAYENGPKKQGYFTSALVEGLGGEAANDRGQITLGHLVKYVQEKVPEYVHRDLGANKQQRPFAIVEGYKADELVIAFAPKNAP